MKYIDNLLKFIKNNKNWKELIQKDPYNIIIKENSNYTLLKYNQLSSDFKSPIVRACRGIILDQYNTVVCFPFYKFFNYGEDNADVIDWESAKVQEKIDGSLIKIWFDKFWHVSTNGSINAYEASLNENGKTFGDLFEEVRDLIDFDKLNKNNTYMFELVSPENQVVIYYPETKIYHIGTRNNNTFEELDEDIGVEKPKLYNFNSLDDLIEFSKTLSKDEEGFVVVDKNYNRIKVKSPQYLMAHYLLGNCKFTPKRIVDIIKEGEQNEILTYFPEFKENFIEYTQKIHIFISRVNLHYATLCEYTDRKEFALNARDGSNKDLFPFMMKLYDNSNVNIKTELLKLSSEKILEMLK